MSSNSNTDSNTEPPPSQDDDNNNIITKEPLTDESNKKPLDRSASSDDNASSDDGGSSVSSDDTRSDAVVYPSDSADDWETTVNDNENASAADDNDDDKDLDDVVSATLQEGFQKLTVDEIPAQVKQDDEAARKKHHHHHHKRRGKKEKQSDLDNKEVQDAWKQHLIPSVVTLAQWIEKADRILVLTGAGVSVAAGIPDFRTPGTGLYDNLQKYNLPYPEAVFDLGFYRINPQPFCSLARAMWPGIQHYPTLTHSFIALLAEKGKLLRNYTQNIDGLEFLANTPDELLVECHGHYRTASCTSCHQVADPVTVKDSIVGQGKAPKCVHCGAYVKPDIVFFGESLPPHFQSHLQKDRAAADLLLVLGTSLQVAPVSLIPDMVNCRRALINKERVGTFDENGNYGDLFVPGDCDARIEQLARVLGWYEELQTRHDAIVAALQKADLETALSQAALAAATTSASPAAEKTDEEEAEPSSSS